MSGYKVAAIAGTSMILKVREVVSELQTFYPDASRFSKASWAISNSEEGSVIMRRRYP
jgi:hypothetical protein